jgi:hypothetical protein
MMAEVDADCIGREDRSLERRVDVEVDMRREVRRYVCADSYEALIR